MDKYADLTFMNYHQVITLLLEGMDLSLALFLGLFFVLVYNRKKSNLMYLGFFLISIAFSSTVSILESLSYFKELNILSSIPLNVYAIIPAFLYLYVDKTSSLSPSRFRYLLFIPGVIDIIFGLWIINFSDNAMHLQDGILYNCFELFLILFFIYIVFLLFKRIRANTKSIENQYSSIEYRELKWVGYIVVSILFYVFLAPLIAFLLSEFSYSIFDSWFWISITIWSVYNGLLQQKSPNLISDESLNVDNPLSNSQEPKNIELDISPKVDNDNEKNKTIFLKVDALIKEDELFLNPELTITDISSLVDEHPKLISSIINQVGGQNFNSYINLYRVEKAKSLLISEKGKQYSIESIGQESGFKSNSSFYGAFKKNMNQTPLQFMKANEAS